MVNIIGISGKKQSGKNTMANYLHGEILKRTGTVSDFEIDANGSLIITTSVDGDVEHGVLDVTRRDSQFTSYAHAHMWPYVKLYSFADGLKQVCMDFFDLSFEQAYGTNEQKNTACQVFWEDLPTKTSNKGNMTARELLQYFGTDIMRKMLQDVWVNHTIKTINREQSGLAIIADIRFPNEVEAVKRNKGKVVRLTRELIEDSHSSEVALDKANYDWDNFDFIINNSKGSITNFCKEIDKLFNQLEVVC
jgi:hypothetical protein